jgi:serine/threonine protein kinase
MMWSWHPDVAGPRRGGLGTQGAPASHLRSIFQVVHRHLKPGNLMILCPGTPQETLKLMDFGLAKMQSMPYIPPDELLEARANRGRRHSPRGAVQGAGVT